MITELRVRPTRPFGRAVFSRETWRRLGRSLRLSHRETEIVQGMFDDDEEASIARRLFTSRGR